MITSAKQKKYVMAFVIIVGLMGAIIYYLAPKTSITIEASEIVEPEMALQVQEPQLLKTIQGENSTKITPEVVTSQAEDVEVLYDTKSDMTIQPVDPETDPANKIDNIEEQ